MKPLFWWRKWGGAFLYGFPGGMRMCREAWNIVEGTCIHVSFYPYKQCRITPHHSPSQKSLHKFSFLQKLGCQKTCLDQATLSSLVNKQVGVA